jgi:hypothetical protein
VNERDDFDGFENSGSSVNILPTLPPIRNGRTVFHQAGAGVFFCSVAMIGYEAKCDLRFEDV